MKKTFISITAVMVALSVITVCAFAAPEKNDKKGAPNRGEGRENFQSESAEGQRPEHMNGDKMPARGDNGFNFDDIGEMIEQKLESVTDEEVKANLEALLEAYNTAADAVKDAIENKSDEESVKALRETCETARKALTDALKEAGIETNIKAPDFEKDKSDREKPDMDRGERGDKKLYIDFDSFKSMVEQKLTELTDSEVKANIENLLAECETVIDAFESAAENDGDNDSLKELRDAAQDSKKALEEALKDAGIETDSKAPAPEKDKNKDLPSDAEKPENIPASTDDKASGNSENGGFLSGIISWFGNLFK